MNMEKCSFVKMSGITSGSLDGAVFTIGQTLVSSSGKGYLQFTIHTMLDTNDSIKIIFPQSIILTTLTTITWNNGGSATVSGITNNTIELKAGSKILGGNIISIEFTNVTNPTS